MAADESKYTTRAGLKLEHALTTFAVDVSGLACADFGCNIGGFTDCLLQHGAEKVYAVDTGYGELAWKLRQDERVITMERTNALHVEPPDENMDLVVIDLGWTQQRLAIPAAIKWLNPEGKIISLIKPHYELDNNEKNEKLIKGILSEEYAEIVFQRIVEVMPSYGIEVINTTLSPIRGGKSSRKKSGKGNVEYLIEGRVINQ